MVICRTPLGQRPFLLVTAGLYLKSAGRAAVTPVQVPEAALSPLATSPAGWITCAPVGCVLAEGRLPTSMLRVGRPADGRVTWNAVECAFSTLSGNKIKSGLCVWELLEAMLLPRMF